MIIAISLFSKSYVFHPHSNAKPAFFVRNVFGRKRQFREGLVRTVDLSVEKSCDFKFPLVVCRRSLIYLLEKTKCLLHTFGFAFSHDLANPGKHCYNNFFPTLCMGIFACSPGLIFFVNGFPFHSFGFPVNYQVTIIFSRLVTMWLRTLLVQKSTVFFLRLLVKSVSAHFNSRAGSSKNLSLSSKSCPYSASY